MLRALVCALVCLHVALFVDELSSAGLFEEALAMLALAIASTTLSAASWWHSVATRRPPVGNWFVTALDTIALVGIARITIAIDPQATLAWAFVLFVPFSIAVRHTPQRAMAGALLVAAAVVAATQVAPDGAAAIGWGWGSVAVPAMLVVVASIASIVVVGSLSHGAADVRSALVDERERGARLREADDLKNTFLAALSHELRTPLTSILGFAMTLLDRPELDAVQRERMLRTVVVEAEHLEDILANLLDLDRLTRGKATLVPVELDPARVVLHALTHVQRRTTRTIERTLERGVRVRLDAAKVERIVENLVANALKYTPEDAAITVQMATRGDGIRIVVEDTGPGIDEDLRATIFEPFQRGVDPGVAGTGIGLSLVDRFSRLHGGRAWVEERPGGGCRFCVDLPSAPAPSASPPDAGSTVATARAATAPWSAMFRR